MAKTQKVSVKLLPITAEDKEKDRITQKKKAPKHDPSEKKELTFKLFNDTDHKNIREDLVRELNVIADKYDVEHIDLENSPPSPDDFFARDWSWRSNFFIEYLKNYEDTIDYDFYPHYRTWLDYTINYCSIMVWNLAIKTMKAEHKKTDRPSEVNGPTMG